MTTKILAFEYNSKTIPLIVSSYYGNLNISNGLSIISCIFLLLFLNTSSVASVLYLFIIDIKQWFICCLFTNIWITSFFLVSLISGHHMFLAGNNSHHVWSSFYLAALNCLKHRSHLPSNGTPHFMALSLTSHHFLLCIIYSNYLLWFWYFCLYLKSITYKINTFKI